MKYTIRVLAIAPYEGLAHLLKLIGSQYDMLHLDIFVGDLEQGLTIARSHLPGRYDAVISRGGTADRIRCITPLPVIDISFSVYDILRSLKLAENYAQNYAFVGFQSIIDTVHILCDLLQYRIETHVVNSEEEIAPTLEQLKKQGITLVFGDTLTHEIAGEMGMNAVFINSGAESIHEAFRQVIQMFNTFSMFDGRVHLLEDAMRLQTSSSIILQEDGKLYFSSYDEDDAEEVLNYLQGMITSTLPDRHSKSFHLIGEKLFSIQMQKKNYKDNVFYLFSLGLSPIPKGSSKNGVRYYNHEEIKSNYFTSFFCLTAKASDLNTTLHEMNASRRPIMILGERGTGKDHIAYRLYLESPYTNKPFISIDCKLITERYWTFLTKHINSPFCDNDNTIYISNIQDLSDSWCRQLLSLILDTHLYKRNRLMLSCSLSIESDRDPSRDFIDYLPCTSLYMPPLRELTDDLPSASALYLNKLNSELSKHISGFEPNALKILCDYDWPDNFLQLKRVLSDVVIHTTGNYIQVDCVKEILAREMTQYAMTAPVKSTIDCNQPLQDIIKNVVLSTLQDCGGNQTKAAQKLGISRTTMWRYLK